MSNSPLIAPLELLRVALHQYRVYIRYFTTLFVTPFILSVLMLVTTVGPYRSSYVFIGGMLGLVASLCSLIASLGLFSALVTHQVGENVVSTLTRGSRLLVSFIPVALILLFVFLGGFSLIIIPGFVIAIFLSQTLFTFMDGKRGLAALLSSWQLVRNNFFAVLGRLALLWVLTLLVTSILTLLLSLLGMSSSLILGPQLFSDVGYGGATSQSLIASILLTGIEFFVVTPFSALFLFELYASLKTHAATAPQLTSESIQKRRTLLIAFGVIGVCVSLVFIIFSRVFFNYAVLALELSPGPNRDFIHTLTEVRSLSPQSVQVHFIRP